MAPPPHSKESRGYGVSSIHGSLFPCVPSRKIDISPIDLYILLPVITRLVNAFLWHITFQKDCCDTSDTKVSLPTDDLKNHCPVSRLWLISKQLTLLSLYI